MGAWGGGLYKITKTCWKHPPQDRSSLGNARLPSPTAFPHTASSSKSLMAKYSASQFQEGYSNWKRWIIGLKIMALVSCCQLYIPAHYITHIQFPNLKTFEGIAVSMLFTLNLNLCRHTSIHSDVYYTQKQKRSNLQRCNVKPIYIIPFKRRQ